jgi:hypothetical protein
MDRELAPRIFSATWHIDGVCIWHSSAERWRALCLCEISWYVYPMSCSAVYEQSATAPGLWFVSFAAGPRPKYSAGVRRVHAAHRPCRNRPPPTPLTAVVSSYTQCARWHCIGNAVFLAPHNAQLAPHSPPTAERMYENGCTNFRRRRRMYEFLGGGGVGGGVGPSVVFGFCVPRRRG